METTKRYELNKELAQMLKGGVIMDVTTPEQAKIAQEAGACAVMALERIPAAIDGESSLWRYYGTSAGDCRLSSCISWDGERCIISI